MIILLVVLAAALVGICAFYAWLDLRGKRVEAEGHLDHSGYSYYTFQTEDGTRITRACNVLPVEDRQGNRRVTVIYLPKRPRMNMPADTLARRFRQIVMAMILLTAGSGAIAGAGYVWSRSGPAYDTMMKNITAMPGIEGLPPPSKPDYSAAHAKQEENRRKNDEFMYKLQHPRLP